jgi:hypothetical protein
MNSGAFEDFVFQVNGGSAETPSGNVVINQIPRSGGNVFSGNVYAVASAPSLSSSPVTDAQKASGLFASKVAALHDYNGGFGGPIKRDRLWFFFSPRHWEQATTTPLVHDGLLGPVGDPIVDRALHKALTGRLTWQASTANKFAVSFEREYKTNFTSGLSGGQLRPEATTVYGHHQYYYALAKWTSVVSNKLFVEAGYSVPYKDYYMYPQPGVSPSAPAKMDVGLSL